MKIASFFGGPAISEQCHNCGLHAKCDNPFTGVFGGNALETLIVLPKPSKVEGKGKSGFTGDTVRCLEEDFGDLGIDIRKSFLKCNAIQCYTSGKIEDKEIESCRPMFEDVVKKYKPKHIITVGQVATKVAIGHMFPARSGMPGIETLTFTHIPVHDYGAWVHPILDPHYVKTENEKAYHARSLRDVVRTIRKNKKLPYVDPFEKVEVLTTYNDIMDALDWLNDQEDIVAAWDLEATNLKPQYIKQVITSVGVATRERVLAWPIVHNEGIKGGHLDDIIDATCDFLENPKIKKIAHHRKFDEGWAETLWNCQVRGALQCTMTNQHLLDHRSGNKSLKYQAFVRWGIREYDKATEPYISSDIKGATQLNRMTEMPLRAQLLYVGADAYLTLLLSDEQDKEYAEDTNPKKHIPRNLYFESTDVLKMMHLRGVPCDKEYYENATKELEDKIKAAEEKISNDPDVRIYEAKSNTAFSHGSPVALKTVLFDIKGIDPELVHKTNSGKPSTDEKALKDIGGELCDAILEYRKLSKLNGTYMSQFLREECDGYIHGTFNLTTPRSYRSSSSDPNMHNIPKHDKYANKTCRSGLKPRRNMGIGEMDFEGMEVSTSASYHKDPNFINYLITPGTDMHWDNTCDLWLLDPKIYLKGPNKDIRYHTKNCWTFPQFYGDYFGSCAPELWKQVITKNNMKLHDGIYIIDHINKKGIRDLKDFTEHCKKAEEIMWQERFAVYTDWKKEINDFYIKMGYVETYMGFRFTGLLDKKQTTNYPIQGTAFHLLLWCLNKLEKWMVDEKLLSYIWGQIHDSILFMWHPDELQYIKEKMIQVCTIDVRKEFEWINVPLGIDIELSPSFEDGGNLANVGKFKHHVVTIDDRKHLDDCLKVVNEKLKKVGFAFTEDMKPEYEIEYKRSGSSIECTQLAMRRK